jgi:hypothetical protein
LLIKYLKIKIMRNIFIIGAVLLAIYLVRGILIKQAAWEAAETEAMEAQQRDSLQKQIDSLMKKR